MKIAVKIMLTGAILVLTLPLFAATKVQRKNVKQESKAPQSQAKKHYTPITCVEEYNEACESQEPVIIAYNSDTCSACEHMESGYNVCAERYPEAKFYTINVDAPAFKGKAIKKKAEIKAVPTTHFRKKGAIVRTERGSMGERELDGIVYHFVHNKPKPYVAPKREEENAKQKKVS